MLNTNKLFQPETVCKILIREKLLAPNQAKEILRLKTMLIQYFADHTGKSVEQVSKDLERDNYMSAQEAADYGLVDKVLVRGKDGKK